VGRAATGLLSSICGSKIRAANQATPQPALFKPRTHTLTGCIAVEYLCALGATSSGRSTRRLGSPECIGNEKESPLVRLKKGSALRISRRKICTLHELPPWQTISRRAASSKNALFPLTPISRFLSVPPQNQSCAFGYFPSRLHAE